jgi:RecJ-like exonuclease
VTYSLPKPCPDCDGDGSLMVYMTCRLCKRMGGFMIREEDEFPVYYTPEGAEMEFKTIGGHCLTCKGTGVANEYHLPHRFISFQATAP